MERHGRKLLFCRFFKHSHQSLFSSATFWCLEPITRKSIRFSSQFLLDTKGYVTVLKSCFSDQQFSILSMSESSMNQPANHLQHLSFHDTPRGVTWVQWDRHRLWSREAGFGFRFRNLAVCNLEKVYNLIETPGPRLQSKGNTAP